MSGRVSLWPMASGHPQLPSARTGKAGERKSVSASALEAAPAVVREAEYDFDRLERALRSLVSQQLALRRENADLQVMLAEAKLRVRSLDACVREEGQRRRDAVERIDELIGQIEALEPRLARRA